MRKPAQTFFFKSFPEQFASDEINYELHYDQYYIILFYYEYLIVLTKKEKPELDLDNVFETVQCDNFPTIQRCKTRFYVPDLYELKTFRADSREDGIRKLMEHLLEKCDIEKLLFKGVPFQHCISIVLDAIDKSNTLVRTVEFIDNLLDDFYWQAICRTGADHLRLQDCEIMDDSIQTHYVLPQMITLFLGSMKDQRLCEVILEKWKHCLIDLTKVEIFVANKKEEWKHIIHKIFGGTTHDDEQKTISYCRQDGVRLCLREYSLEAEPDRKFRKKNGWAFLYTAVEESK